MATNLFVSVTDAPYNADPTGASDSSTAFNTAVTAFAGTGVVLFVPAGTYKIGTTINVPPGLAIKIKGAGRNVTFLKGALGNHSNPNNAILWSQNTTGGTTTLSSNVTVNGTTLSCAGNASGQLVQGAIIAVSSTSLRTQFYVISAPVTGAGPYAVTVDRPIRDTYLSGGSVVVVPLQPTGIEIEDMSFTGTADRAIEIIAGYRCFGRRLNIDAGSGSFSDILASFDIGGRQCAWEDCFADAHNVTTTVCYALESNENSHVQNVTVANAANSGVALYDCIDCTVEGESSNCYVGVQLTADGNTQGSLGCIVKRWIGTNSNFADVYLSNGCVDSTVEIVEGYGGVNYGVLLDGNIVRPTFGKIRAEGKSAVGAAALYITAGASQIKVGALHVGSMALGVYAPGACDAQIRQATFTGTITTGITVGTGADIDVEQCTSTAAFTNFFTNAGTLRIRGLKLTNSNSINVGLQTAGRLEMSHATMSSTSTSNLLNVTGGEANVDHFIGVTSGDGIVVTTGAKVRVGFGVDLTSCTTPFSNTSATITLSQDEGTYTSATATGTDVMSPVAAKATKITSTASLTGNTTVNVPAGISGLRYIVYFNGTLNAHTWSIGVTGGTAISIGAGKHAIVESNGTNMLRVTADT